MRLKMSGVLQTLAPDPAGSEEPPDNRDTCVISAAATISDSSKAPNTSLLDRRYLSTHHQFGNPLNMARAPTPDTCSTPPGV